MVGDTFFSTYKKQRPPISCHPHSHSPFSAIQSILSTYPVLTTIPTKNFFPCLNHSANKVCEKVPMSMSKGILWELVLLWSFLTSAKHEQIYQCSQLSIPYCSESENWYTTNSSLWGLILVIRMANYPVRLLLCSLPTAITFILNQPAYILFLSSFCQWVIIIIIIVIIFTFLKLTFNKFYKMVGQLKTK